MTGATGLPRGEYIAASAAEPVVQSAPLLRTPTGAPVTFAPETPRSFPPSSHAQQPVAAAHVGRHLDVVQQEVASCTKCELSATRSHTVFERGNREASLCIVGEAPGADEDASGLPFVGKAGQLLDRMIAAMGLDRERDVYVCNVIKCRPPANRKPSPAEMATCLPYAREQLAAVKPKVILAMGNTAIQALLGTTVGITKLRGQWKLYQGETLLMPTYHPSYLLREFPGQADAKRQVWEDLQLVMKELGVTRKSASS